MSQRVPSQAHGADVYDPQGRLLPGKDFSSTVPSLAPPAGWRRRAGAFLGALERYPRPFGRGLDARIERSLGLPSGSVLLSNGASEALDWCARLAAGKRVRLLAPCFGEYRPKLERGGAQVEEFWWDASVPLDLEALVQGLRAGDQVWLANPGNPLGQVVGAAVLARLAKLCARKRLTLLVDEALLAQRLDAEAGSRSPVLSQAPWNALVVRSLGKGLGMPGLRLGYVAAPPALARRLRRFQDPWSVNTLAQEMGAWALSEERRASEVRRLRLKARSVDLSSKVAGLRAWLKPLSVGSTGYGCVDLGAPIATGVTARLAAQGLFVRDCSSFGGRARSWLRLNPRSGSDNRILIQALSSVLKAL